MRSKIRCPFRLAYADYLEGPWSVHEPGVLAVADSHCLDHVASPDVHLDADQRLVRMYYHGVSEAGPQVTRVALSSDGVTFQAHDEVLGSSYFRVFRWDGWHYALGMPGVFYRSRDGLSGFEVGPTLFTPDMRHSAVWVQRDMLHVFYSDVGDNPERICAVAAGDIGGVDHDRARVDTRGLLRALQIVTATFRRL